MDHIKQHKFHLISICSIFVLFLISVSIRQEKLNLDMSPEHEWITAHTLMTLQIWDEAGGPHKHGFNPVYTFDGAGGKRINSYGGVTSENGDMYYVSYPPFAFIFSYYTSKLLGGPDVASLRTLGLIIHFFCAFLIYLIIINLRKIKEDKFSIAAILGPTLYLFSAGTLWMHGIMYFSDMLVQLLLIWSIYLLVKLLNGHHQRENWFLLGVGLVCFLGVYTEWIALFFAFFSGITLLIIYFVSRRKELLKAFFIIGGSATLAIGLTLYQYSSIAGFDSLIEVSESKYEERSGNQETLVDVEVYNWDNPESFRLLEHNLNRNFQMVTNLFAIILIVLVPPLVWRKSRQKMKHVKWKIVVIAVLLCSILLHYILFYNFNAIHNFSNLKTGFFMILSIAIVSSIIEESLNWKLNIAFAGLLIFLLVPRCIRDFKRFDSFYAVEEFNIERDVSASTVREYRDPDTYVFGNIWATPEYMYKAHHNTFPLFDTSRMALLLNNFGGKKAQYYHHENQNVQYLLELELKKGNMIVMDRIDF